MKTNEEVKHALCDMVRARIGDLGLTQVAAANLTGYTQGTISEIVNRKTDYGVDSLVSLLGLLGKEVDLEVNTVRELKGLPRLKHAG